MQKIFLVLTIFLSFSSHGHTQDGQRLVGKADNLSELLIAPGSLYAYNRFVYRDNVPEKFIDLKILGKEEQYFLMCKGQESGRIHAFVLSKKENELFLSPGNTLYVCKQGEVSLDSFLWEEGLIKSCADSSKVNMY